MKSYRGDQGYSGEVDCRPTDSEVIKTRRRARKSSAGFGTTQLLIGAEGTLRMVTEAVSEIFNFAVGIPQDGPSETASSPSSRADTARETAEIVNRIAGTYGGTGCTLGSSHKDSGVLWQDRKNALWSSGHSWDARVEHGRLVTVLSAMKTRQVASFLPVYRISSMVRRNLEAHGIPFTRSSGTSETSSTSSVSHTGNLQAPSSAYVACLQPLAPICERRPLSRTHHGPYQRYSGCPRLQRAASPHPPVASAPSPGFCNALLSHARPNQPAIALA
ncbi:hypothetical protein K466DRAFT_569506 [Polyporus arcularius HHB13444]|uniref:Uncharacterized protein n=1 Tax=Polyporus arcularius HHB13444 TaxID=1314778 RepID=A0A5C3NWG2_9APHY|nr:hypothetical protein K466DRAFT_569506 [Polyporus arcularius HHB13444]